MRRVSRTCSSCCSGDRASSSVDERKFLFLIWASGCFSTSVRGRFSGSDGWVMGMRGVGIRENLSALRTESIDRAVLIGATVAVLLLAAVVVLLAVSVCWEV